MIGSVVESKIEPMLLYFAQRTFSDGTWVTVSNWCGVRVRRRTPVLGRGWVEYQSIGDTGSLLVERFATSDFWGGFVSSPIVLPGDVVKIRQSA